MEFENHAHPNEAMFYQQTLDPLLPLIAATIRHGDFKVTININQVPWCFAAVSVFTTSL